MRLLLCSLLLLVQCIGFSQTANRSLFITDSLDNHIRTQMAEWDIPGVAVAIIKDGKPVLMKGYGVTEKGGTQPVDEHTLFLIGSNTKAFTATAIAMLDAQKKLSLNDPVTKWMPEFKLRDEWVTKNIIVKDLLCHRLGFETFQGDFTYWTSNLTRKQIIAKMQKVKPLYGFRDKWGYCNAAFLTAGEIIPRVTGRSWEDFMRDSIFKPLGMNRTLALSVEMNKAANVAIPHSMNHSFEVVPFPHANIDNLAPAGSIGSTVHDMGRWAAALLNGGKADGKTIIPAQAINNTRIPQSVLGRRGMYRSKSHYSLYGLGWFLGEYAGREIVSHTGGVNGFVTSLTLVPEEKLAVIVLTNTDHNELYSSLNNELLDAMLQLPYTAQSQMMLKAKKNNVEQEKNWLKLLTDSIEAKQPQLIPFSNYAGTYSNELYGNITIVFKNNHLNIHFQNHPNMTAELDWLGNH
ncbi:MAG: serine hydrolase, partial [Dinghuibacter sp.]|nr:serine hydrolase [Dinghuibacter sp.]